jgi:hypothetical protein
MAKAGWREKAWEIVSKIGSVPKTDVPKEVHWQGLGPTPTINTSATAGTGRAARVIERLRQSSTTSVEDMLSSGFTNTVWTLSPRSVAEQPSILLEEELPLEVLETADRHKLVSLAEGMGCSPQELVMEIIRFYVENDADILECGTVFDTVQFYLTNEIVG